MINIVMTVKTIHILDRTVEIPLDPNYDNLGPNTRLYPSLWNITTELIAFGELPRYRGAETTIVQEEDRTILTVEWPTRAGAEKWVAWVLDDNYALISIDIVED
jgi:hypothetical protein